jgi:hypothetical protein
MEHNDIPVAIPCQPENSKAGEEADSDRMPAALSK